MKNVLEFLEDTIKSNKTKTAIIKEQERCSYTELLENSKRVGSAISRYIEKKEPIAVLMDKSINTIYAFLGIVYAGGFYTLLNPDLPQIRLEKILKTLDTKIIITDDKYYNTAFSISGKCKILKIEELKNENINLDKLEEIRRNAQDTDPLYINFTSGSTGTPKGVVISHKSVIDFINVFTEKFNITKSDIIANQAPFDFDVSVKDIYSCIKTGATLLLIPKKYFSIPTQLLDYICENNATTLIWAVSALCLITTFHGLDYKVPKSINKILFSGEVMPIKHLTQWIEHLPNALYVNLYGPTEVTCNCTYHIIDKKLSYEKQIPIGKPFDNEAVFLLDEKNNLITKENVIGEICVCGTCLSLGYYNNDKQTNISFIQNPLNNKYNEKIYKTGDMGYLGDNNEIYFCGRKDFQIKHMGHRIELEEIEFEIQNIKEIERCCCIYDFERGKLYAFYIGDIIKNDLRKEIMKNLPVFMVPNILRKIDKYPLTKNGKIDRKQLLKSEKQNLYKKEDK